MRLRYYDNLRNFIVVARHESFASAADQLCLTKGALSHQIRLLEDEIGFALFERHARGIRLTAKGKDFLATARLSFGEIERKAQELAEVHENTLTIGVTTYFASRWLSPRLTEFIKAHPEMRLRIQPMIELFDLRKQGVDLAIRWGNGRWNDCEIEKLLDCPAWPTGNMEAYERVQREGLDAAFSSFTLLRDRDDSNAWSEWYRKAGLRANQRADTLIIPDPNVRVQAVIDGQGVALNDDLVAREIEDEKLIRLSSVELSDFGYFIAYEPDTLGGPDVSDFIGWLHSVR